MAEYISKFQKGTYPKDPVHMPGDEGTCPEPGQSDGAPQAASGYLSGPEEVQPIQKPGQEGSHSTSGLVQGDQPVPPSPLGEFLQGPEVRKTRVMPASGSDEAPGMPGA